MPMQQNDANTLQPAMRDNNPSAEAADAGYSASATSSGSGFFGQTSLLEEGQEIAPLPENAPETLAMIKAYFQNVVDNADIGNTLSVTHSKNWKQQSEKLEHELDDLILNNKMSHYAYSRLLEIFNSLQSRQYEAAAKQCTDFTKSCKSNKQEKFTTHRKWVMAFQAVIRIAKQYNI